MRFGVLGPLEVRDDDGQLVALGGPQPRAVFAALIAARGEPIAADVLIDAVWGETPPPSAASTLHSYVSRLRKAITAVDGAQLVSENASYRLVCPSGSVDLERFDELCLKARDLIDQGRMSEATDQIRVALGLWRGPALPELADHAPAAAEAARLDEERLAAHELCIDLDLELGRHHQLVGELTALVAEHPLRESLWVKLALALYRCGRQSDALRSLAEATTVLRDELGLDPGEAIREIEQAILEQEPWLQHAGPVVLKTTGAGQPSDDFVGRAREVDLIVQALDEAVDDARFVVIDGEPGIGKTRLADEVRKAAMARGSTAVWGRCDERGAAPALWPWLEVVRQLHVGEASRVGALGEVLTGEVPFVAGQGRSIRFERFVAVADLLRPSDPGVPLVVLLDDIQWADPTSLDLLRFLTTRAGPGVLVVATTRTPAVGRQDELTDTLSVIARRHGSQRHRLDGLSDGDTKQLLKTSIASQVSASTARTIHARAEGNPFYTIQLGQLLRTDPEATAAVPATVRDTVRFRISLLPLETAEPLAVAAVVGREFDLGMLARSEAISVDDCARRLEPALDERILVDALATPGALRFSHALVREVLLDGLTSLRRARVHMQVADAMEADGHVLDDVEVVAEHLWRAVSLIGPERAAEALERAAEVALHRVAYTSAEDLLDRATRLRRSISGTGARQAELSTIARYLEVMQATRYFCGADHGLLMRARSLASELGQHDLALMMLWFHWSSIATAAEVANGTELIDELHDACRTDARPSVRAIGEASRGVSLWSAGDLRGAIAFLDRSVELVADAPDPIDAFEAESRLSARSFQLWVRLILGTDTPERIYAEFDAFVDRSPVSARPAVCCFASTTAAMLLRIDDLDHFVSRARSADPAAQFAFWGGQLLMYEGLLAAARDDFELAVERFDEGRDRYLSVGARSCLSAFEALLAELLVRGGRLDEAATRAGRARAELDRTGEEFARPVVAMAEAVVASAAGDRSAAAAFLAEARAAVSAQGATAFEKRLDDIERGLLQAGSAQAVE